MKTIIITGVSSGLGKVIAKEWTAEIDRWEQLSWAEGEG